ncbi:hypothetical protein E2L07_12080 [Halalkalibacterium halodurans]|nr:hypothetical protein E2L07_12080 [Halalkalibacterium halodurans]
MVNNLFECIVIKREHPNYSDYGDCRENGWAWGDSTIFSVGDIYARGECFIYGQSITLIQR